MSAWEREDNLEQPAGMCTPKSKTRQRKRSAREQRRRTLLDSLPGLVRLQAKGRASEETTKPKDISFSLPGEWDVVYLAYFSFCTQFLWITPVIVKTVLQPGTPCSSTGSDRLPRGFYKV